MRICIPSATADLRSISCQGPRRYKQVMGTFIKSIGEGIHDGRFRTMLRDHCLQWRYNLTRYAINNVVAHLADSRDDYELFETLSDNEFRSLKVERFGINAVGSDLQKGLEFFSVTQPDLLKFLQI